MSDDAEQVSAEFPFESKYQTVLGSRLHYVERGEGRPFLLLHGNPTSSYLWRNIIPHLSRLGRVIAPDLIGMGRSDKPSIEYRFADHARFIDAFIDSLELRNITFVVHDWGSGLGFDYAARHPTNVAGLAFMEAIIGPMTWSSLPLPQRLAFKMLRAPMVGWFMLSVLNMFVTTLLPRAIERTLSREEVAAYRKPYPTVRSRKPVRQWPRELPFDGRPSDVHEIVLRYRRWLEESDVPKLLIYSKRGALIPPEVAKTLEHSLPNLETAVLESGVHYLQEDHPHEIGKAIASWYEDYVSPN